MVGPAPYDALSQPANGIAWTVSAIISEELSMNYLELKVPPVVVVLITALAMWLVAWLMPSGAVVLPARILFAVILAILGSATSVLGVVAFLRARTTVNPTKPEAT